MTDYRTRLALDYAPSKFQEAIFDWVVKGRGHAAVEAVAGAGKTTTIVAAAHLLSGDGLFCAFNRTIAGMLKDKLAGTSMTAKTVHSHGYKCIRDNADVRVKVDARKYKKVIKAIASATLETRTCLGEQLSQKQVAVLLEDGFPTSTICRLVDLARVTLLDASKPSFASEVHALAAYHDKDNCGEDLDDVVARVVKHCLVEGARSVESVDYTDMIWLPVVRGWRPDQFSWIFVDECQDISACALALIAASRRRGGRLMFVGDPRQAINGFAGADARSFAKIVERSGRAPLPLSVCYRCPTKVLDMAREYCPTIQARDGAPAGTVKTSELDDYITEAREGDLVLCRKNAPLISACFRLIAEGVSAVVRGRDIAEGLIKSAKAAVKLGRARSSSKGFDEVIRAGIDAWESEEVERATRRIRDEDRLSARLDQIRDQGECLSIIHASSKSSGPDEFYQAIRDLFSDDVGSVTLSSIHKAKGLEAERVAILESDNLPGSAKKDWQQEQERNLVYVAYTRAMDTLILIK